MKQKPAEPQIAKWGRNLVRIMATLISVFGVFFLVKIFSMAFDGSLARTISPKLENYPPLLILALALPVPFHIISIGLILQKRWLSPKWAKNAWLAIVSSGLWLGAALIVRAFVAN